MMRVVAVTSLVLSALVTACGDVPPATGGDRGSPNRAEAVCVEEGRDFVPDSFDDLVGAYPTNVSNFQAWERAYFERRGVVPAEDGFAGQPDEEFVALCVFHGTTDDGEVAIVPKGAPPPPDGSSALPPDRAVVVVTEGGLGQLWAAGPRSTLRLEDPPRSD